MCAYANADYIMAPDGEHMPLPAIDGAAVFHTRPDGEGWKVVPAAIDADVLLPIFHALLATMVWLAAVLSEHCDQRRARRSDETTSDRHRCRLYRRRRDHDDPGLGRSR